MKQSDLEFITGIEYFVWFTISLKIKADFFSEEEENMQG